MTDTAAARVPGFSSTALVVLGLAVLFVGGALLGPAQPVALVLLVLGGALFQVGLVAKGVKVGLREARD